MDQVPANREGRYSLYLNEPEPLGSVEGIWQSASRVATIGIFLLLFGAFLYIGRPVLLPIIAAAVIATMFAPLIRRAERRGVSPWLTAIVIEALLLAVLGVAVTTMAGPVSDWIARAPEIGATIKGKLSVFEQPIAALRQLEAALFGGDSLVGSSPAPSVVLPVVAFLTPAAGELLLFFGTLLFLLVGQLAFRSHFVALFATRGGKLRFLKIMNDIERNLAGYVTVVTVINAALGVIVTASAWVLGFPSPAIFGLLAALLNYVPYVGPAVMVIVLFAVGLATFPSLGHAVIAPLGFIGLTTMEGHFVTPTIVGRRLMLSPLLVVLALAFWTWMWGPFGALLATPLSIIALVVVNHLFPNEDMKLPD